MAVTYEDALATDRDRVRFMLGDTVENSGPLPEDANFTDDEIAGLITLEGSWQRAVAAGFEALASRWSLHPSFDADGLEIDQSDVAKRFAESAKEWRNLHGGGTIASRAGSRAITRVDGYSSDEPSHES